MEQLHERSKTVNLLGRIHMIVPRRAQASDDRQANSESTSHLSPWLNSEKREPIESLYGMLDPSAMSCTSKRARRSDKDLDSFFAWRGTPPRDLASSRGSPISCRVSLKEERDRRLRPNRVLPRRHGLAWAVWPEDRVREKRAKAQLGFSLHPGRLVVLLSKGN